MGKIKIKKEEFKELYNLACDPWKTKFNEKFKDLLFDNELEFEEEFISEMKSACTSEQLPVFLKIFKSYLPENLFDKIKTYQDVCDAIGEDNQKSPYDKIKQIEKLFNETWKKNWKNKSQKKWYPYYTINDSGRLVFDSLHCRYVSFVGEVAFFKDQETANFVGKQFIDIYQELANN